MHKLFVEQIPWYAAGTLSLNERRAVADHLAECAVCQQELRSWQAIAQATQAARPKGEGGLPPLSPLITIGPQRRPQPVTVLRSGLAIVWAQRSVVRQASILPSLLFILVLGMALAGLVDSGSGGRTDGGALVLALLIPLVAIIGVVLLYGPETDSAFDLVAATPTRPITLLFARLTLLLVLVISLALLGSALLTSIGIHPLTTLIYLWLGPMLCLAALATLLAMVFPPLVAMAVPTLLWGTIIVGAALEMQGIRLVSVSLHPVLEPDWIWLAGQVALAGILWALSALALSTDRLTQRMKAAQS